MSSTTTSFNSPPAPWKQLFTTHLSQMPSPEFVLSTVTPAPSGSAVPYLPRARYCIYRGMWASLPSNSHNDAEKNPKCYDSDLPTFTTDVRMEKVPELFATGAGHGSPEQSQGSGGGGPVEAVWWVKERMTQWRVKGTAWVVGPDAEGAEESSGVRSVKSEVGARMRVVGPGKEEWSWKREIRAHFGNISPGMRGSFKNPPPGSKVEGEPDKEHQLGQKVQDLDDEIARDNFRVVVIKPDEVERVDLTDPEMARRFKYTFVIGSQGDGEIGTWTEEELWP